MERETYLARFVARFTREVGDFLRTQLAVGLTLSCLTLVFQWRMGLLPIGTGRASLLALVLPYVVIVAAFGLYHLFRTAYLLDKELQASLTLGGAPEQSLVGQKEPRPRWTKWAAAVSSVLLLLAMLGSLSYGVFRAWKLLAAFMAPSAQGSVISQPSAPRVPTKARPSGPTAELGLALGAHLDADFETFQTCATAGVSCLGESELEGKTVPTPVLSPGRARLAVLVTIQGGSDYQHQIVTSPHVLIATLLPGVGISYAEQEQTPPRESVEFTEIELFPASMEHEPKAYTVDLTFAPNTHMIPLAIRIWGNNLATHQVTTRLRILNRQSGAKATGTTP